MSESFVVERQTSNKIGGNPFQGREKDFPRPVTRVVRALWPRKTAAHIATITGTTERAAKNWLAGDQDPPATLIAAIVAEITSDFR